PGWTSLHARPGCGCLSELTPPFWLSSGGLAQAIVRRQPSANATIKGYLLAIPPDTLSVRKAERSTAFVQCGYSGTKCCDLRVSWEGRPYDTARRHSGGRQGHTPRRTDQGDQQAPAAGRPVSDGLPSAQEAGRRRHS